MRFPFILRKVGPRNSLLCFMKQKINRLIILQLFCFLSNRGNQATTKSPATTKRPATTTTPVTTTTQVTTTTPVTTTGKHRKSLSDHVFAEIFCVHQHCLK